MATSNIPTHHRALVLHSTRSPYDMSVTTVPTPTPTPGSAIIRISSSSVLTYAHKVYSGLKPYPYPIPFVPGSSSIGRIASVGPDATLLAPGQLIFFDCYIHGRDDPTSLFLHGLSAGFTAGSNALMEDEWRDGTYAEYAKVPLENCFPLDESRLLGSRESGGLGYTVDDLMYLLTLSIPFGGLRDVDVKAGEKVIITPATGTFGSAAVVVALAMGARVVAMGRNLEALQQLQKILGSGAGDRLTIVQNTGDHDADTNALIASGPADVFLDISPGAAAKSSHFKSCILALRRGGRMSMMGAHYELALPTQTIMLMDITVKGKWMYTKEDIRVLIKLVENGFLKLGKKGGIKTVGRFGLEQFAEAFESARDIRGTCEQVVIAP